MVDKTVSDSGKNAASNMNAGYPDPDQAHDLMHLVLEHYVTHHQVVFKKLHHAQNATTKSINELENMSASLQAKAGHSVEDIRKYDHMWGAIIEMFKAHGATEDDLERIEQVLLTIPRAIKRHYDMMVEQDKALQTLIKSLDTEEYRRACKVINDVQSRPNPMSGLGPEEYKPPPASKEAAVSSYKFSIDMLRDLD